METPVQKPDIITLTFLGNPGQSKVCFLNDILKNFRQKEMEKMNHFELFEKKKNFKTGKNKKTTYHTLPQKHFEKKKNFMNF